VSNTLFREIFRTRPWSGQCRDRSSGHAGAKVVAMKPNPDWPMRPARPPWSPFPDSAARLPRSSTIIWKPPDCPRPMIRRRHQYHDLGVRMAKSCCCKAPTICSWLNLSPFAPILVHHEGAQNVGDVGGVQEGQYASTSSNPPEPGSTDGSVRIKRVRLDPGLGGADRAAWLCEGP